MDKYRKPAEKMLKGIHPDLKAKEALVRASFASQQKEEFFNEAFGEIMVDYFMAFIKTEPHETKTREFIYNSILALGDVKKRLTNYEMYGKNIPVMEDNNEQTD